MTELLTPQELAALEAEVQKELDKELKAKLREDTKKKLLAQARQDRGLIESIEQVLIDLPESGNCIRVNNREYQHGQVYNVASSVAMMLRDTMQRAWEHQAEIEGRHKDHFRKQKLTRMSMATGAVQNAPFLKV